MKTSADLIAFVSRLGGRRGVERSVKVSRGQVLADRCLASIELATLGDAPLARLVELARELEMPQDFIDALPEVIKGADNLHFGFEGAPEGDVRKVYLEYASSARRAMVSALPESTLVHVAFKWSPGRPSSRAIARYTRNPCATLAEIQARIGEIAPPAAAPIAFSLVQKILARMTFLEHARDLMVLAVEESGNPRRSFDLNLYEARLRLAHINDLLVATLREYGAPIDAGRQIFEANADAWAGHVAGGVGRSGDEFATIYFDGKWT